MAGNYSSLGNSGNAPTKSIVNFFSSGGTSVATIGASGATNLAKEVLSGALTSATLATVLTISAPGQIAFLTAYSKDATARTIRIQVILDGVTVFDATSNSISASGTGIPVVASGAATAIGPSEPIRFNSSCVIKVASSLTETDKVAIGYVLI